MAIDFEDSFGFLVGDITRLIRERFNAHGQSLDLTQAQSRALVHLARNEGVNQVTLARLLEIQPITLLRQLDRLEQNGLIERRPDEKDRRMQRLFLTAAASPLLDQLTVIGTSMTDSAFNGVSQKERDEVMRVLKQVKQNLFDSQADDAERKP